MKLYNREHAIQRMNTLAKNGKDFIFIINYKADGAYVEESTNIDPHELLFAFPILDNIPEAESYRTNTVEWHTEPLTREDYEQRINLVKQREREGDSYLANLTCRIPVRTNLSLHDVFMRSKALYRCWLKEKFVCFSPEIFVRINKEGLISSFPMKGTIDATRPDAEKELMENKKEAAEHATIVDLIRNDLSMIAEQVQVKRYRYVDHLTTNKGEILQTSSEITGQLPTVYRENVGTLLFRLLPAGSITGAPKPRTMEIIDEAEGYERGFYTGVMGCYSKGQLDSAVMIRFIDQDKDGQLHYKAGGGITAQSNNNDEYKEVIEKVYVPIY
ncbi:aminodeoxychorismate synthase component I [Prevotella fusca]|uniref:aminodeoxychorismate synthase component I n=1 Tax=Prevotella fusca TaxID=589436 RepID=UPI003FA1573C